MANNLQNSTEWLRKRRIGDCQNRFRTTQDLVKKLKLDKTLEGHQGCVNCLEWNLNGRILASGSDDRDVILWDSVRGNSKAVIKTGHEGNIFSVKFMPNSGDSLLATGAADGQLKVIDVLSNLTILNCKNCHSDRVKRIAVHRHEPYLIWSAAEDGKILEFDTRISHTCHPTKPSNCNLIIDLKTIEPNLKAKCIAINPLKSSLLAIGANDQDIRLIDRRKITDIVRNLSATRDGTNSSVRQSVSDSNGATYLTFNSDGSELLVNMNRDQVHLYNINEPLERYKSFESTAKKLLCGDKVSQQDVTQNQSRYRAASDWDKLKGLERTPMSQAQQSLCQKIQKILENRQQLPKYYHDKMNEMLADSKTCPELFELRASALISRGWRGDDYQALRDTCCALALDPNRIGSLINLAIASERLGDSLVQSYILSMIQSRFGIEKAEIAKCKIIEESGACSFDPSLLFNDYVYLEEASELGLISHIDNERNINNSENSSLSINLERVGHLSMYDPNGGESKQIKGDYSKRYCGHCNLQTDIKEANFFGTNQEFILAGSDDGAFYIWDKRTTNLVKACNGDLQILNCLQPHPIDCILATSGIEPLVKLWSPFGTQCCDVPSLEVRCQRNQTFLTSDPWEVMIRVFYQDI